MQPVNHNIAAAEGRELISFWIGAQEFCVDIMVVREIRSWTAATPLPQAPPFVRGVINLRGAVLPIIELAVRLGFEGSQASERSAIIVTQIGAQAVGLLVDGVSDILTVTNEAIQPPPDVATDGSKMFLRGLIAIDGRMISLIGLEHLLPDMLEAA